MHRNCLIPVRPAMVYLVTIRVLRRLVKTLSRQRRSRTPTHPSKYSTVWKIPPWVAPPPPLPRLQTNEFASRQLVLPLENNRSQPPTCTLNQPLKETNSQEKVKRTPLASSVNEPLHIESLGLSRVLLRYLFAPFKKRRSNVSSANPKYRRTGCGPCTAVHRLILKSIVPRKSILTNQRLSARSK